MIQKQNKLEVTFYGALCFHFGDTISFLSSVIYVFPESNVSQRLQELQEAAKIIDR